MLLRFDLVNNMAKPSMDTTGFSRIASMDAPLPGEIVNLKEDPYCVISRGWAVEEPGPNEPGGLYCFLRVIRV